MHLTKHYTSCNSHLYYQVLRRASNRIFFALFSLLKLVLTKYIFFNCVLFQQKKLEMWFIAIKRLKSVFNTNYILLQVTHVTKLQVF